jgi:hypothetical protein
VSTIEHEFATKVLLARQAPPLFLTDMDDAHAVKVVTGSLVTLVSAAIALKRE